MNNPYYQLRKPYMLECRAKIGRFWTPTFTPLSFENEVDARAYTLQVWGKAQDPTSAVGWVERVDLFDLNQNKYIVSYPEQP